MSTLPAFPPLPTVPPLPGAAEKGAFTGQQPAKALATAPRKSANVTQPTQNVTQQGPSVTPDRLDPADFTALRQVLETTGHFTPAPPDPPWADPRPDLVADRARWWLVLEAAWRLDGQDPNGLYGALNGMRCCGARLEIANAETWGARPEDPPPTYRLVRGEELSEAEYADLRQRYLMPHREALTRLLNVSTAAQIAHPRPTPAPTFTGAQPAPGTPAAPRKPGASPTAAQLALLETAPAAQRAPVQGGDW